MFSVLARGAVGDPQATLLEDYGFFFSSFYARALFCWRDVTRGVYKLFHLITGSVALGVRFIF